MEELKEDLREYFSVWLVDFKSLADDSQHYSDVNGAIYFHLYDIEDKSKEDEGELNG